MNQDSDKNDGTPERAVTVSVVHLAVVMTPHVSIAAMTRTAEVPEQDVVVLLHRAVPLVHQDHPVSNAMVAHEAIITEETSPVLIGNVLIVLNLAVTTARVLIETVITVPQIARHGQQVLVPMAIEIGVILTTGAVTTDRVTTGPLERAHVIPDHVRVLHHGLVVTKTTGRLLTEIINPATGMQERLNLALTAIGAITERMINLALVSTEKSGRVSQSRVGLRLIAVTTAGQTKRPVLDVALNAPIVLQIALVTTEITAMIGRLDRETLLHGQVFPVALTGLSVRQMAMLADHVPERMHHHPAIRVALMVARRNYLSNE